MLRIILRHTHNALIFACILLLLCSFERLWRYDYDRGDETARPLASSGDEEERLQEDHFVFWGGVPAWERSLEVRNNPVGASLGLFRGYMSFSSAARSWTSSKVTDVNLAAISSISTAYQPTTLLSKADDNPKDDEEQSATKDEIPTEFKDEKPAKHEQQQTQQQRHLPTAQPLEEAKILLRRQIRHNKKKHQAEVPQTSPAAVLSVPEEVSATVADNKKQEGILIKQQHEASVTVPRKKSDTDKIRDNSSTEAPPPQQEQENPPKIGFVLHLPDCDKETVSQWQTVWHEQVVDQPFLFHVLLGASVDPACMKELQSHLDNSSVTTTNKNKNNDKSDNYRMVYQVSQNEHLALSLQTCQSPAHALQSLLHLEEALYYDASKAKGRLRSSAIMRRFVRVADNQNAATYSSVFRCSGGQQKQAFCDDSALDCPWFQYSPGRSTDEEEEKLPSSKANASPPMKLEASIA